MSAQPSSSQMSRQSKRSTSKDPYGEGTAPKKTSHDPPDPADSSGTRGHAQIREDVRAQWHLCEDLDQFAKLSNMDKVQVSLLAVLYPFSEMPDVQSYIFYEACTCYMSVKGYLPSPRCPGVRWIDLESPTGDERNELVVLYVEFMRVHAPHLRTNWEGTSRYYRILKQLTPLTLVPSDTAHSWALTANAFHRESRGQRSVAGPILEQIVERYTEYQSDKHIAPSTSIVGPSGIGKSFAIQQMAREGNYVVYTSLAPHDSLAYPRRSVVADQIADFVDREQMTVYFECFVAANMVNVQLCREFNISPLGFFDVQVKTAFLDFQSHLCDLIRKLYDTSKSNLPVISHPRYRSGDKGSMEAQEDATFYQDHVTRALPEYRKAAKQLFSEMLHKFRGNPDYKQSYLSTPKSKLVLQEGKPSALLCFDEARQLFAQDSRIPIAHQDMRFLALRRALRHQTEVGKHKDSKRFFAVLLDTTARISDFSPPRDRDSSLKLIDPSRLDLLDPIFKIDTMDLYASEDQEGWQELMEAAALAPDNKHHELIYLHLLGRPLWGALLRGQSLTRVLDIAKAKIFGRESSQTEPIRAVEALAVLSYRVDFYVALPTLAETLTANYLRFIVHISQSRNFLQTLQPSEPILSYCSTAEMTKSPHKRLDVIKALYDNTTKGTIHLGDLGEMVATLLLLFTYDKAHGENPPVPMKLPMFLETLFAGNDDLMTDIIKRVEDQEDMKCLWEDGVVFFNHFGRLTNPLTNPLTEANLRKAFYRGAALYPPRGFKGCDMIVPILLPRSNAMSYIVLQIKNRGNDTLSPLLCEEARDSLKAAAHLLPSTPAHIGIMMSLRSHRNQESVEVVYPAVRSQKNTRSRARAKVNPKTGIKFSFNDLTRVVIASVGLSLDLYPGFLHPREKNSTLQSSTSRESIEILKKLLACTTETHSDQTGDYHDHLAPLG